MELEYMWLKKLSNSKQNRVSEFLLSLYFNGIWHFGIFFGAYMDSLTISMSVSSSIPNTVGILAVGQWFLFLSVVPNKDRTNKKTWLVVEPTPLKNMSSSDWIIIPIFLGKIKY